MPPTDKSNTDIKRTNPGINVIQIRMRFQNCGSEIIFLFQNCGMHQAYRGLPADSS